MKNDSQKLEESLAENHDYRFDAKVVFKWTLGICCPLGLLMLVGVAIKELIWVWNIAEQLIAKDYPDQTLICVGFGGQMRQYIAIPETLQSGLLFTIRQDNGTDAILNVDQYNLTELLLSYFSMLTILIVPSYFITYRSLKRWILKRKTEPIN